MRPPSPARFAIAIGAVLVVAAPAVAAPAVAAPARALACPPLPGADAVLRPGARIFVGEMHGTDASPRAFAALVCHAAKLGPVRVGLEWPASVEPALATFLASAGSAADRAALLRVPFFLDPTYQDGRRSQAMIQLVDDVRALRRAGADVDVTTFDSTAHDRDGAMAERAAAAIARAPKATWLLYAGNLHARKTRNTFGTHFMAMHLVERGIPLVTLDARPSGRSSAWVCMPDCGPHGIGHGAARPVGITLAATSDGAYDGVLDLGVTRFSPPAALPVTAAQRAQAAAIGPRADAADAYAAKRYERCATAYAELARTLHAVDDAYDAACCWALAGRADAAFAALGSAVDFGFSDAANAEKDGDLAALHADARWKPLLARMAARAPKK